MSTSPSTTVTNRKDPTMNNRKMVHVEEKLEELPIADVPVVPISDGPSSHLHHKNSHLPAIDRPYFTLLVILYLLQGVPVGLAFGSVPFLLKSKLSYSQVGIFSLAAYPYSLKLLWSPIVDAIYSRKLGRRKTWIIPIQTISGLTMLYLGSSIETLLLEPAQHLHQITFTFFILVFFCATQDIAVDGWALTVLSPQALSYASTAQTIGLNSGYFLSFTIFLAFNSPDFANKYLRSTPLDEGLFTMGQYLTFWGWMYLLVTVLVYFFPEDPPHLKSINSGKPFNNLSVGNSPVNKWHLLKHVYKSMYQVLKLSNVQIFVVVLLISKFGFQANEAATNLKLLEKGFSKENLAITVLIDFPFEIIFGYYAARWSTGKSPLDPWLIGFIGRLVAASLAQLVVYFFPADGKVTTTYFVIVILQHLLGSFMSTIQFVCLSAFHTKIADPVIGGTYMTTLNTLSNFGGNWPRLIVYSLIDRFTVSNCVPSSSNEENSVASFPIIEESLKEKCKELGGVVEVVRDGYFYTNFFCISMGILIFFWVRKRVKALQNLPNSAWRVEK